VALLRVGVGRRLTDDRQPDNTRAHYAAVCGGLMMGFGVCEQWCGWCADSLAGTKPDDGRAAAAVRSADESELTLYLSVAWTASME